MMNLTADGSQPKYSLLLVRKSTVVNQQFVDNLFAYLKKGIKILLITDNDLNSLNLDTFKIFIDNNLLQIYIAPDMELIATAGALTILDGSLDADGLNKLENVSNKCPEFNLEQYKIEHSSSEDHLKIIAGAGTGKTTVMIQRVMFLLHTTDIDLKNIHMITFTNEAANNMRHKIKEEFLKRYQATRKVLYLQLIEELNLMRISTIHSFAKYLLGNIGSVMGYGHDVKVRKLRMERRRIIEQYFDKSASKWVGRSISEKLLNIPLYRMVDIAESYWEEMEKKGLTDEEIRSLDWGATAVPEKTEEFHDMFIHLFQECEYEFQNLKQRLNAVSLNDLIRQVEIISRSPGGLDALSHNIKFLFVDEFQDTDDSQIRLFTRLIVAIKLKLFVVGDVKQSIYRFRGADYTAFDQLEKLMKADGEQLTEFTLNKNYRTSAVLLTNMDKIFTKWGNSSYLTYSIKERLISVIKAPPAEMRLINTYFKRFSEQQSIFTIDQLKQLKASIKDADTEKIAVLVRTNEEALKLRNWCDEASLNTYLEAGGTLFRSVAAREFFYLIEGLLYPKNPISLLNLYNTSYSNITLEWTVLAKLNGSKYHLIEQISRYKPRSEWDKINKNLKLKPVLSVIRDIVNLTNPFSNYYHRQLSTLEKDRPNDVENKHEANARAAQYQKNFDRIMELLHKEFNSDFITLYSIHKWLTINMASNREENEPELDETEIGNRIRILTVHKAKGLEFHTVILPFTDRGFYYDTSELLLQKKIDGGWRAGWKVKDDNKVFCNEHHGKMIDNEKEEVLKEEVRLLYVAMTRCKHRLWIINNSLYNRRINWSSLFV